MTQGKKEAIKPEEKREGSKSRSSRVCVCVCVRVCVRVKLLKQTEPCMKGKRRGGEYRGGVLH